MIEAFDLASTFSSGRGFADCGGPVSGPAISAREYVLTGTVFKPTPGSLNHTNFRCLEISNNNKKLKQKVDLFST
jgi:hypothetical protein